MKQVTIRFDPFMVTIGMKVYGNISPSSVKRLDKTLVDFCETGKMEMFFYSDFYGTEVLSFEPVETTANNRRFRLQRFGTENK